MFPAVRPEGQRDHQCQGLPEDHPDIQPGSLPGEDHGHRLAHSEESVGQERHADYGEDPGHVGNVS